MMLSINVNPNDVITWDKDNGRIIVKLENSNCKFGASLCTVDGKTKEEFDKNDLKKGKNVFIGKHGGITLE